MHTPPAPPPHTHTTARVSTRGRRRGGLARKFVTERCRPIPQAHTGRPPSGWAPACATPRRGALPPSVPELCPLSQRAHFPIYIETYTMDSPDKQACERGHPAGCGCGMRAVPAVQDLSELGFERSACRAAQAGDVARLARMLARHPHAVHSDGVEGVSCAWPHLMRVGVGCAWPHLKDAGVGCAWPHLMRAGVSYAWPHLMCVAHSRCGGFGRCGWMSSVRGVFYDGGKMHAIDCA
eukprot:280299-Chlamydomonas_euryale.AAC.2